jgi:ubiquinone biosynthesis protein
MGDVGLLEPARRGELASLPRRRSVVAPVGDMAPPMMRVVSFRVARRQVLVRLTVWFVLLVRFAAGVTGDRLRRRDTLQRRAVRLRHAIESAGGAFVKIGQHLAMRLDLLPWHYSVELSRMLDRVPAFPLEQAVSMVERATGGPLAATFSVFDPEPIGSTAVSCVYQGRLADGQHVAVKVRRPGAGELFMADLAVLEWLLRVLELMTILRRGYADSVRREVRETLVDELDFVQEARFQDSFRRAAKKSGKKFFTAPRVHLDLSSEDVIVEEFADGIWLWELLAAVERGDEQFLEHARRLNIDPKRVARRLTWVNYWGWHEHLFFHANPHPDKIIVRPDSRLTFIDFGAVSAVGRTKRRALQQNMHYAAKNDPLNMARATLILLEPLPSIDTTEFAKELVSYNWQLIYALAASPKSCSWHERTSAVQWLGLIKTAKQYGIVIDFHVLRLIRSVILYDALSVRLHHKIDIQREYRRFARHHAHQVRRQVSRNLARQAERGVNDRVYLRMEQLADTTEGLFFRVRHALTIPSVSFSNLMDKSALVVHTTLALSGQLLLLTAVAVGLLAGGQWFASGETADLGTLVRTVVSHRGYHVLAVLLVLLSWRKLSFRLSDKDA